MMTEFSFLGELTLNTMWCLCGGFLKGALSN